MIKKVVFRGTLLILGLLVTIMAVALVWRASRQREVSQAMAIRDANGIDERRHIRIGGVEQWITIRGRNRDNPAVLVLHGGPGAPISALAAHFIPWERDFTVIQWDQRGAGKSYYPSNAPPSIDLMIRDGLEVS